MITDRKWAVDDGIFNTTTGIKTSSTFDGLADYYVATIVSYSDYDPFGTIQDGRKSAATDYRYGFQGQEADDEIKGEGNSYNYEYRMHDPRLGRFFAIDPLAPKYPQWTPYAFSGNQVIHTAELEGLEPEIDLNETESFDIYGPIQGERGDQLAMTTGVPGYLTITSMFNQAEAFAKVTGGKLIMKRSQLDDGYAVQVEISKKSSLGKQIIRTLEEKHGIKYNSLTRKERKQLLRVGWKEGHIGEEQDDRSDLFHYRPTYEQSMNVGAIAVPVAGTIPILVYPGDLIASGTLYVDVSILGKELAGRFANQMSKVARGNQRQGDFEGWLDEEVDAEYQRLSKPKLTKEEKALKLKLKKEQKTRRLRDKQKNSSEKGEGTGRK